MALLRRTRKDASLAGSGSRGGDVMAVRIVLSWERMASAMICVCGRGVLELCKMERVVETHVLRDEGVPFLLAIILA